MGVDTKQASFTAGYLTRSLRARTDLSKYQQGLATCDNWIVKAQGGVVNRPGTKFVAWTRASAGGTKPSAFDSFAVLLPFIYSADQSYVLELTPTRLRVYKDGTRVATGITITTPWAFSDLRNLRYAQVNDVMWIVDGRNACHILRRYGDDDWTLGPLDLTKQVLPPTSVAGQTPLPVAGGSFVAQEWEWVVTSVDVDGRESLPSVAHVDNAAVVYAQGIANYKIEWTAPTAGNAPVRYNVYRGRNGVWGYVGSATEAEFTDRGEAPAYTESPPQAKDPFVDERPQSDFLQPRTTGAFVSDTATKTEAAEAYNGYYTLLYDFTCTFLESVTVTFESRPAGGGAWTPHGTAEHNWKEGESGATVEAEYRIAQAGLTANSEFRITFTGTGTVTRKEVIWNEAEQDPDSQPSYPRTVAFQDQRIVFAGFSTNGQRIVSSRIGDYWNFDTNIPTLASGPIDATIVSKRNDPILSLIAKRVLFAFTAGGEYIVRGDDQSAITPLNINTKGHTDKGIANVDALHVEDAALFVQRSGDKVMELVFDEFSENKILRELTILAEDLFRGKQIVDWAFQEHPYSVVWVALDDGSLLGMTFQREHQVFAWHQHTTDGFVESLCVVPEGQEDALYLAVDRNDKDGGSDSDRVIERMAYRLEDDPLQWIFLDSTETYDGTNAGATTMVVSGGPPWTPGELLTVTASAATFAADESDVGDPIVVRGARLLIREFTSTTVVEAEALDTIPTEAQSASTVWAWARRSIPLTSTHLNDGNRVDPTGYTVGVLADGKVMPQVQLVNVGTVPAPDWRAVIPEPATIAHVGLPYTSDLETLEFASQRTEVRARTKIIKRLHFEVLDTKNLKVGQSFDKLQEARIRTEPDSYGLTSVKSGLIEMTTRVSPRKSGGACVRQEDPLPAEIISMIPELEIGD